MGIYIDAHLEEDSIYRIKHLQRQLGIEPSDRDNEYHITLFASHADLKNFEPKFLGFKCKPKGLITFENGKVLALELDCPELIERHKEIAELYGIEHMYEVFIPHITLDYFFNKKVLVFDESIFDFEVQIYKEYSEEYKSDWEEKTLKGV